MRTESITTLYLSVIESQAEPSDFDSRIDSIENDINETLKQIGDGALKECLDSLIGALAINSEYKGFAHGLMVKEQH